MALVTENETILGHHYLYRNWFKFRSFFQWKLYQMLAMESSGPIGSNMGIALRISCLASLL
jgi:hypothetical protein